MDLGVDAAFVREYGTRTLAALGVVLATLLLSRGLGRAVRAALTRHRAHANAALLVGNTAKLVVGVVGALLVLAIYSEAAFAWVLGSVGVVGLVVGLSLQDLLKNFFAGVWILVEQPFRIGETIQVEGAAGVVEHISYRVTWLLAEDGRAVIIPNATLLNGTVVNLSRSLRGASATAPARYSHGDMTKGSSSHE